MDKKTKKLEYYVNQYLGKTPEQIIMEWGKGFVIYNTEILCYNKIHSLFFRDEIVFFIKNGYITDIAISECILWIDVRNIFHYKDETPQYKVINLLKRKKKNKIVNDF